MILTAEQEETHLVTNGWTSWQVETSEGRKITTDFWRFPEEGPRAWYYNELRQAEYANPNKRYARKDALRVQRLCEETTVILAKRQAEAQKNGAPAAKPKTAEQAAMEAMAAEATA